MSLTSIRVYPDWQARLWQSQAEEKNIWKVAIAVFAPSILFLLGLRVSRLELVSGSLLADGIVKTLYLTVGLILIARRVSIQKRWLAGTGLVVIAGVLLGEFLAQQISNDTPNTSVFFLACTLQAILLILPGWSMLALVFVRGQKERGERLGRIGARVLHGLVAGGVIVGLMYLAQSFSGLEGMPALPPLPLLVQRVAFAVGLQSVAEELFFRRLVFRHLYMWRGEGFWAATCVTLLLNLVVYAIQVPPSLSPLRVALRLTAACTMIVINAELYSREPSLIGPIVSNAIFQIFFFTMTWG
jgi:hypothetical protein